MYTLALLRHVLFIVSFGQTVYFCYFYRNITFPLYAVLPMHPMNSVMPQAKLNRVHLLEVIYPVFSSEITEIYKHRMKRQRPLIMKNRRIRLLYLTWKYRGRDILKTNNNIIRNYLLLFLNVTICEKKTEAIFQKGCWYIKSKSYINA